MRSHSSIRKDLKFYKFQANRLNQAQVDAWVDMYTHELLKIKRETHWHEHCLSPRELKENYRVLYNGVHRHNSQGKCKNMKSKLSKNC